VHASHAAGHTWLAMALSTEPGRRSMHGCPYLQEVPGNEPQEAPDQAPPDTPPARPIERPATPGPREIPLPSLRSRTDRRAASYRMPERRPFVRDEVLMPYRRRIGWP
jgi:hypothetical protein